MKDSLAISLMVLAIGANAALFVAMVVLVLMGIAHLG